MTKYTITERIYITYKTRMLSEARLLRSHRFLTNVVTWYSFCLICFGLIQISGLLTSTNATIAFTAASVATFGMSLYVNGQKLSERAEQFRACHLQLKALYESPVSDANKMKRYAEILKIYENQDDTDYDEMIFNCSKRGQDLYNAEGPILLTNNVKCRVRLIKAVRFITEVALVCLVPAIFLIAVLFVDRSGGQ